MTSYACLNPGCPKRDPVAAASPPICYTCAQPMREVALGTDVPSRAWFSFGGTRINGEMEGPFVEISEPMLEQRAARTAEGITIEVTPTAPADVEAFVRNLQAEILRALTTIDRVPYDQPVTFRNEEVAGMVGCLAPEPAKALWLPRRRGEQMDHVALLRRDPDGASMLLRFAAPQFVRSGSCGELRIEETVDNQQWAFLIDAHRHNRDLAIECAGLFTSSRARIDGMSTSDAPGGGHRVKLLLKAILSSPDGAPPYAIGDEVEWRTGPLDMSWRPGRVTAIVDDRPNDGIDKPFWIVRVDTAGERRFCGPHIAAGMLRRLAEVPVA